jgi:hypothetical protein
VGRQVLRRKIDILVPIFLGVDQSRQFSAAAHASLAPSIAQPLVDRGLGAVQTDGDRLDRVPCGQQAQHFEFLVAKRRKRAGQAFHDRHAA